MITDDKLYEVLQAQIDDAISHVLFGMTILRTDVKAQLIAEKEAAEDDIPEIGKHGGTNKHNKDEADILEISASSQHGTSRAYRIAVLNRDAPDIAKRVIAMKHKPDDLQIWYEDESDE